MSRMRTLRPAHVFGKLYRETKKEQGGTGANQYTEQRANNLPSANTAERIAEQFNASDRANTPSHHAISR